MTRGRKPDFVKEWRDKKTGRAYLRFRRKGQKEVSLRGPLGSEAFWEDYKAALATKPAIGAELRSKAGSVSAAIAALYLSTTWTGDHISDGTRGARKPILERFRERYGHHPLGKLNANFLDAYLEPLKPHARRNHFKALRMLLRHAKHDVTAGMTSPKAKSTKWTSWPDEWCKQYEAHHPIGTKARLAYAIARYSGAATSDVARMGPRHIVNGEIIISRKKTGVEALVVVHPELQKTIDVMPVTGLSTFLVTKSGKPYRSTDLSEQFRAWCDEAGLPNGRGGAVIHGLRHRMGDKIAESSGSPSYTAAVLGHASLRSAMHYMQGADRKKMARAGMAGVIASEQKAGSVVSNHDPSLTLGSKKVPKNKGKA